MAGGVLYRKEREVIEFLAQFQKQYGYSPTLAEICGATGHKSKATVHAIIRSLVDKGYLQKVDGNVRVLRILDPSITAQAMGNQPSLELPIMGYIAAGKPLEPHTDPNATLQVSSSMISGQKIAYVLQVKGNSMIDDGIFEDDYVVIEKTDTAKDGDIVVAMVDNSMVTLKRYYVDEHGRAVLKPANSEMEPIYPRYLAIQGKCVGLIRKFNNF